MAGGSIFDDFTGDDCRTSSPRRSTPIWGHRCSSISATGRSRTAPGRPASRASLAVNTAQADFDNDGRLDVILVRGGCENAARLTLLRDAGGGRFADVTVAAGLGEPIASDSAAWGDFDNDGRVNLSVCGEYATSSSAGLFAGENSLIPGDPRNHGRLYRDNGDGTSPTSPSRPGSATTDMPRERPGRLRQRGRPRLYAPTAARGAGSTGRRRGTFTDVARELGVTGPPAGFPCGLFDFDNDGRLDRSSPTTGGRSSVGGRLVGRGRGAGRPQALPQRGRRASASAASSGLGRVVVAMGMGVGDVDNDGFLDIYLGWSAGLCGLDARRLYKNVEGRRFKDIGR